MRRTQLLLLIAFTSSACRNAGAGDDRVHHRSSPGTPATTASSERLCSLMIEVGHRFELMGKAAVAGDLVLARYEADELQEVFADEIPRSRLPDEDDRPPVQNLLGMADAFLLTNAQELQQSLARPDRSTFDAAFARAAAMCNACHAAASVSFIRVPNVPGMDVPIISSPERRSERFPPWR